MTPRDTETWELLSVSFRFCFWLFDNQKFNKKGKTTTSTMAFPRLGLISRRVVVVALFCAMAIHYAEAAKLAPPPAPCSNGTNNFTQEHYITRG